MPSRSGHRAPRASPTSGVHGANAWGEAIFDLAISPWNIIARTLIVGAAVLVAFRLAGKRELGQLTPADFIVILLIANAVQNAMVGPDTSVTGGLIAAGVLIAANHFLTLIQQRVPWLRRAIEGSPTLLIDHGKFIEKHLRSEAIDKEHVLTAMREHGIEKIEDVEMAVLEVDGSISIVPAGSPMTRTRRHARLARKI